MKKQKMVLTALALAAVLGISGCGKSQEAAGTGGPSSFEAAIREEAEESVGGESTKEESAGEENPAEDTVILAVSFGTSYNESRDKTIGAIEEAIVAACPEYEVRRAFTSQIIIDKLKKRDNLAIDNVTEALDRAAADGVKTLVVQPTHLMNGLEYQDIIDELTEYKDKFERIVVGEPLLTSEEDFQAVAKAVTDAAGSYDDGETAIVFMGHGTEADSNQVYGKMQETLTAGGFENYFIGTVEAKPSLEDVTAAVKASGDYKRVVLVPFMVVAGDHAVNDMAGDEEDSWKSVFAGEGYEVECLLMGLGEMKAIREIYVGHVKAALEKTEAAGSGPSSGEPESQGSENGVNIPGLSYSHSMELKYAKEFSVDYYEGGYALVTIGDSDRFLLIPEGEAVPEGLEEGIVALQRPVKNIYLAASAVMDMFAAIDGLGQIRFGSLKEDGWCRKEVREAMEAGDILYAGKYAAPDYERIVSEGCGLAVENTMIYHTPQVKEQLERFGIPVLVDYSSHEKEPLGRMEWVLLYGILAGREEEAGKAYLAQAEAFERVESQAKQRNRKDAPTVAFFYITENGGVNIRKASDYLPKMIEMAGGSYLFADQEDEGKSSSMTIQMEEFYAKAKDADYLIYNSTVDGEQKSLEELEKKSGLLKNFKAVQEGNVFCTTKDLYQSSMELGTVISDFYGMLEGGDRELTYLYRLE